MKQITRILIFFLLAGCSSRETDYSYIKIFSIDRAAKVTSYNKGMSINNYLYYSPSNDSVFLKYMQDSPDSFNYYTGSFKDLSYTDTLYNLISYLSYASSEKPSTFIALNHEGIVDDGTLIEYKDSKGIHYKLFKNENLNDSIRKAIKLIHKLETSKWNKTKVNDTQFNDTIEVVNFLKGLGVYDSLLAPYVPLPCLSGLQMEKILGRWRTIGDRYNDATLKYWVDTIDSSGNWFIDRVTKGETKRRFTAKIVSIKNNIIKVKSEHGITTLEILSLTDNCFEYKLEGGSTGQIWRLDRMD